MKSREEFVFTGAPALQKKYPLLWQGLNQPDTYPDSLPDDLREVLAIDIVKVSPRKSLLRATSHLLCKKPAILSQASLWVGDHLVQTYFAFAKDSCTLGATQTVEPLQEPPTRATLATVWVNDDGSCGSDIREVDLPQSPLSSDGLAGQVGEGNCGDLALPNGPEHAPAMDTSSPQAVALVEEMERLYLELQG